MPDSVNTYFRARDSANGEGCCLLDGGKRFALASTRADALSISFSAPGTPSLATVRLCTRVLVPDHTETRTALAVVLFGG